MIDIPVIETARLRLTALTERHFDDYAAMLGDPESTRWVGDGQPLDRTNAWRSLAMLIGHWQLRGYGMWALELKESGEFIGRAGLFHPEAGRTWSWAGCSSRSTATTATPPKRATPCSISPGAACTCPA
ncbi:N-acetyltransferase GCN5 [Rhodanobacter sp. 115]|nr:N-acetyltransferase GCN5 [Rhodanobacter sp. 115]